LSRAIIAAWYLPFSMTVTDDAAFAQRLLPLSFDSVVSKAPPLVRDL
jgi:hypothetical protein